MNPYVILTDSSSDLTKELLLENDIISVPLYVTLEGG